MVEIDKINDIAKRIAEFYNPDKIILFGSYAYGNPNENSDLDFLIIKDSDIPRPERASEIRKMLYGTMIPMDVLVYTNKEILDSMGSKYNFIYQAIKNGKTLYERKIQ